MSDARFLRTAAGTYLSHHHGKLRTLPVADDTCKFHFDIHHHHVAIRTHHHHFVGVNHAHEVYITDHHHSSQLFHVERMPDGRIALKSHAHHTYIGVDGYGHVRAHHHIEPGQLFYEMPVMQGYALAPAPYVPQVIAPPPMVVPQPVYPTYTPGVQVYAQPTVVLETFGGGGHHHHHHGHHHHHHHHGHH